MNPWANRIPRTAAEWVDHDLHFAQQQFEWTSDHLEELVHGDRSEHWRNVQLQIAKWTNVYLWEALRKHAPEAAERAAVSIAEACEAGDSFEEWLWQWREELNAGQPLTLPGMGKA